MKTSANREAVKLKDSTFTRKKTTSSCSYQHLMGQTKKTLWIHSSFSVNAKSFDRILPIWSSVVQTRTSKELGCMSYQSNAGTKVWKFAFFAPKLAGLKNSWFLVAAVEIRSNHQEIGYGENGHEEYTERLPSLGYQQWGKEQHVSNVSAQRNDFMLGIFTHFTSFIGSQSREISIRDFLPHVPSQPESLNFLNDSMHRRIFPREASQVMDRVYVF